MAAEKTTTTVTHTLGHAVALERPGFVSCGKIGSGVHLADGKTVPNNALNEENERLNEENKKLEEEKSSLQEQNKKLEEENRALQEQNKKLEEEKRALQEQNKKVEQEEEEEKTLQEAKKLEDFKKHIPSGNNVLSLCPVAASTTYSDVWEPNGSWGIENTINSSKQWVSGNVNISIPDQSWKQWLIYRLPSSICNIVDEIQLKRSDTLGTEWMACFKMGYAKPVVKSLPSEDDYNWTYTFPEFPLTSGVHSIKLPSPVACTNGGVLKIEFRVTKIISGTYSVLGIQEVVVRGRELQVDKTTIPLLQRLFQDVVVNPS